MKYIAMIFTLALYAVALQAGTTLPVIGKPDNMHPKLMTAKGEVLTNVVVVRTEPDSVTIKTKSGIKKIYFCELSTNSQAELGYDDDRANEYLLQKQKEKILAGYILECRISNGEVMPFADRSGALLSVALWKQIFVVGLSAKAGTKWSGTVFYCGIYGSGPNVYRKPFSPLIRKYALTKEAALKVLVQAGDTIVDEIAGDAFDASGEVQALNSHLDRRRENINSMAAEAEKQRAAQIAADKRRHAEQIAIEKQKIQTFSGPRKFGE